MDYIVILGRQHELGIAELESLYGPGALMPINKHACFVSEEVDFDRLGSSIKSAKYIETLASHTVPQAIEAALPYHGCS